MRKKITSLTIALLFTLGMSGVSLAAHCKGQVVKMEGKEMVVKIKGKCKAKVGDNVKIKIKRAAAVEGC